MIYMIYYIQADACAQRIHMHNFALFWGRGKFTHGADAIFLCLCILHHLVNCI